MKRCQSCETAYSDDFARVFGDNQNQLHRCPNCSDHGRGALGLGAAAGLDTTVRLTSRGGAT